MLIIDSFAGGGGASTGIEMALGRSPDIAINHDATAIAMHERNHPNSLHVRSDIWEVDPVEVCGGRAVSLMWASPDCKHFSKAKGGKPVEKKIRGLAWAVVRWARAVRPAVIVLENVEEFKTWGPLTSENRPCPKGKGRTFQRWVGQLRTLGYTVEWRELRASDYGAPTTRNRLYLIARCDGRAIEWPAPTHGKPQSPEVRSGILKPWRAASEIIDWALPCHSIFLTRSEGRALGVKRPLVAATMGRIAKGVKRYVLDTSEPFLVPLTHRGEARSYPVGEPMRTVTGAHRGETAFVTPFVSRQFGESVGSAPQERIGATTAGGGGHSAMVAPIMVRTAHGDTNGKTKRGRGSQPVEEPLPTTLATRDVGVAAAMLVKQNHGNTPHQTAIDPLHTVTTQDNRFGLVSAFLAQHNLGSVGHKAEEPLSTITGRGTQQQIVSAGLVNMHGSSRRGSSAEDPTPTQTSGGWHLAEVRAFLTAYFGNEKDGGPVSDPLRTVTSKERFGLVTVRGELYRIMDIGMRMLTARELFRAQGFPDTYVIDERPDGKRITKTDQIRMCGNSVCPQVAAALVTANCKELRAVKAA